jgi:hypothetical protein
MIIGNTIFNRRHCSWWLNKRESSWPVLLLEFCIAIKLDSWKVAFSFILFFLYLPKKKNKYPPRKNWFLICYHAFPSSFTFFLTYFILRLVYGYQKKTPSEYKRVLQIHVTDELLLYDVYGGTRVHFVQVITIMFVFCVFLFLFFCWFLCWKETAEFRTFWK